MRTIAIVIQCACAMLQLTESLLLRKAKGRSYSSDFQDSFLYEMAHLSNELKSIPSVGISSFAEADNTVETLLAEYTADQARGSAEMPIVVAGFDCENWGNTLGQLLNAFAFAVVANLPIHFQACEEVARLRMPWRLPKTGRLPNRTRHIFDVLPEKYMILGTESTNSLETEAVCFEEALVPKMQVTQIVAADEPAQARTFAQEMGALAFSKSERAQVLFRYGVNYAFGAMFKRAYLLSDKVTFSVLNVLHLNKLITQATENAPRIAGDSFWLGVHARHFRADDDGTKCLAFYKAKIRQLLVQRAATTCAVFIASDRIATLDGLKDFVLTEGCTPIVSPWPSDASAAEEEEARKNYEAEHGVNDGVGGMRDIYMLSFADTLIASYGSTFSMRAQEMAASRYSASRRHGPTTIICNHEVGSCLPEVPLLTASAESSWYSSEFRWPDIDTRTQSSFTHSCQT